MSVMNVFPLYIALHDCFKRVEEYLLLSKNGQKKLYKYYLTLEYTYAFHL